MSAVEQAVAHFAGLSRRCVNVPEWGDGDDGLKVYWKPWTIAERQEVNKRAAAGDMQGYYIQILILKALDEKDRRLFTKRDVPRLLDHCHEKVIERVAAAISSDDEFYVPIEERLEDARGN